MKTRELLVKFELEKIVILQDFVEIGIIILLFDY